MKKLIVLFLMTVMGMIYMKCDNPVNDPPATYTVTYNGNGNTGGSVPTDANSYETGATVTIQGNTGSLAKTGHIFISWNTAANGGGTDYAPGATFAMGSANVILYAQWTAVGTVTDIDGNVYHTIQIGNQVWTIENLRTTKYNDGSTIPNVTGNSEWENLSAGAYCYYENDAGNKEKYGALYNWHAVNTGKLAIVGWHVPTDEEWQELEDYLIANGYNWDGTTTGNKIAKSMATKTDWSSSNKTGAVGNDMSSNNSTVFSALPGGSRFDSGFFNLINYYGDWWSATEYDLSSAYSRSLSYNFGYLGSSIGGYNKEYGFSVRLVKE